MHYDESKRTLKITQKDIKFSSLSVDDIICYLYEYITFIRVHYFYTSTLLLYEYITFWRILRGLACCGQVLQSCLDSLLDPFPVCAWPSRCLHVLSSHARGYLQAIFTSRIFMLLKCFPFIYLTEYTEW